MKETPTCFSWGCKSEHYFTTWVNELRDNPTNLKEYYNLDFMVFVEVFTDKVILYETN